MRPVDQTTNMRLSNRVRAAGQPNTHMRLSNRVRAAGQPNHAHATGRPTCVRLGKSRTCSRPAYVHAAGRTHM
jgi:hypothetical protein